MLETVIEWLILYKDCAPYIVFLLLLLTGCSFPISEDLLIIASGVLASSVLPEKTYHLFIASFLGAYLADWISYWIGRLLARRVHQYGSFLGIPISKNFSQKFEPFFKRWGVIALIIGRLIPFGFRNGIFMTAGAGRMHFGKFLLSDGISCLFFSSLIFWLAFCSGAHGGQGLEAWMSRIGLITFVLASAIASCYALRIWRTKKNYERVV